VVGLEALSHFDVSGFKLFYNYLDIVGCGQTKAVAADGPTVVICCAIPIYLDAASFVAAMNLTLVVYPLLKHSVNKFTSAISATTQDI
jgi:hypothetical protein